MALDTYDNLKTTITSWMSARTDIAAEVDDFIDMTEADVNRLLRVREMETSATSTPDSSGQFTLPSDYLEYRALISTRNPRRPLALIDPLMAEHRFGYRESDLPNFFTIIGTTVTILPVDTTDVLLLYYQKLTALDDTDTSNWLLAKSPNTYLFGCIRYAAEWIGDFSHADRMEARFQQEIAKLNSDDKGQRYARAAVMSQGQKP